MRQALVSRSEPDSTLSLAGRLGEVAGNFGKIAMLGLLLVLGGAATQAQTVASLPTAPTLKERYGSARPVPAWVDFCRRHASECEVNTSEPAIITMTPEIWRTIDSVNRRVNRTITPITDMAQLGVVDRWDFPDNGYGDCEDFQLLKRKMLRERGLPQRAMRMTVVIDELNEGHAVLMIRTDRGDFILDNKHSRILSWEQTGYIYVKREGHDSTAWVSLGGVTSPVQTANR